MTDKPTLTSMLEKATIQNIPTPAATVSGDVDLRSKATLLRYETLLQEVTRNTINEHSSQIQTLGNLHDAIATYDEDYLLGQPISYLGIASLAEELLAKCRLFKVTPPESWVRLSRLRIDWEKQVETLELRGN